MGRNRGIRAGRRCLRTDGDFVPRAHALDDAGDRRRLRADVILSAGVAARAAACGQRAGGRDHHYGLRTGGRPAGQCEVRLACLGLFRAAWQCAGADLSDVYRDLVRGLLFVPVGGASADACGLSTGYGKRAGCHEA